MRGLEWGLKGYRAGFKGLAWRFVWHAIGRAPRRACKVFRVRFFDHPMKPPTSAAGQIVCRSRSQDQRKALKKIDPNNLTKPYKGHRGMVDRYDVSAHFVFTRKKTRQGSRAFLGGKD